MRWRELTLWLSRPAAIGEHLPIVYPVYLENGATLPAGIVVKVIRVRQVRTDCWEATVRSVPST